MKSRSIIVIFAGLLLLAWGSRAAERIEWDRSLLKKGTDWYRSAEARAVADSVIQYQSPQGGWPKNTNLAKPPRTPKDIPKPGKRLANTIDNHATTLPMRFLARVADATGEEKYRASFLRGVDYLLAAQYANGGWPQFWPLKEGYYSHITYNDSAMVNVMTLLRDAVEGKTPYDVIDDERQTKMARAFDQGIACILKTQIKQNGKLTGWCAQHDKDTFAPAWARTFEPPSLSGRATAEIVELLMSIQAPSNEVIASITGAVQWLGAVQIDGVRVQRIRLDDGRSDRQLVADPDAPSLWARFYELKTNRPLYVDRDSVFNYDYSKLSKERRNGYSYLGMWPASLLEKKHPKWREKHQLP